MLGVLVLSVNLTWGALCPTYSCHEGGVDWGETCFIPVGLNFQLQVCEDPRTPYCSIDSEGLRTDGECTVPPATPEVKDLLPGQPCNKERECLSNSCLNGKCRGFLLDSFCTAHSECDVGNYCSFAGTCQEQVGQGEFCISNWDCLNTLACNRTIYNNGTCVPYFSIGIGDYVGMCSTGLYESISELCVDGACEQNVHGVSGTGSCRTALMTQSLYPAVCTANSECVGNNGQTTVEGLCECGMNPKGDAYCNAFSGDSPSVIARNSVKTHLGSPSIVTCHTLLRLDDYCMKLTLSSLRYKFYKQSSLLSKRTPKYADNDYCVKLMLNGDYYLYDQPSIVCPAYECEGLLSDHTCTTYAEGINSVLVRTCTAKGELCDSTTMRQNIWSNSTCTKHPTVPIKYPGETCTKDSECITNNCFTNKCFGLEKGKKCSQMYDCNVGLHCGTESTCQTLIRPGGTGCATDFDCELTAGCDSGTCVKYFSVPVGQVVNCSKTGVNYICVSGYCTTARGVGECINPPVLIGSHPERCFHHSDCTGAVSDLLVEGNCQCGFNMAGASFCVPFLGDVQGKAYLEQAKEYLTYNLLTYLCSTTRRFEYNCWSVAASYLMLNVDVTYLAYYNYTNYVDYILNPSCVVDSVTSLFWGKANRRHSLIN